VPCLLLLLLLLLLAPHNRMMKELSMCQHLQAVTDREGAMPAVAAAAAAFCITQQDDVRAKYTPSTYDSQKRPATCTELTVWQRQAIKGVAEWGRCC
jgi:hypothetical protein